MEYTNVIPVLAKADQFTAAEQAKVKEQLLAMAAQHRVEFFDVESTIEDQSRVEKDLKSRLRSQILPLSIINPNEIRQIGNGLQLGRKYDWGFASSMDPKLSDFKLLYSILTQFSTQELRSTAE